MYFQMLYDKAKKCYAFVYSSLSMPLTIEILVNIILVEFFSSSMLDFQKNISMLNDCFDDIMS